MKICYIPLQAVIGYSGTFFLYGSLLMLGTVFILFAVPETKGKTPEEILQYFKVCKGREVHLEKLDGEMMNMKSKEDGALQDNLSLSQKHVI